LSPSLLRIQKYLSEIGFSSRREVEKFIENGWVAVNGSKITDPSIKIDPKIDKISFDKKVKETKAQYSYYLFNKPKDVVTVNAQEGETEILDIVKVPKGVVTVGRLDKFSTGLIILTNDPVVARRLMDPDFYHEKEYLVEVTFPLNHRIIEALKKPIEIYGQKTRPPIIVQKSSKKFLITLTEGKNRQIRKICEAVGLRISFLHRVRIVNLQIANLEAGQLKKLNQREVERLKKDLEIKEFEFEYF
jgi:23S rRNA pseudouridine2604 synthase